MAVDFTFFAVVSLCARLGNSFRVTSACVGNGRHHLPCLQTLLSMCPLKLGTSTSSKPHSINKSLMVARICSANLGFSSRCRNRKIILTSGMSANSGNWANSQYKGTSKNASSMPESDQVNYFCKNVHAHHRRQ